MNIMMINIYICIELLWVCMCVYIYKKYTNIISILHYIFVTDKAFERV